MKKHGLVIFSAAFCMMTFAALAQNHNPPKGDIERGEDVFEGQCYDCHNADSTTTKSGPGFKGVSNGKLPSGDNATRENVLAAINAGFGVDMPAFEDILSDQEKEDVIAYVLSR